jgi:NADPH2:quinone reductase
MYEHGAPSVLRLETVEIGRPEAGEVRLVQDAIGVNYVDTMVRDGRFAMPLPLVPGFEGAGVIGEVVADVHDFAAGDRVGYFFSAGGYASERLISASDLIALPDDVSTEQAAMFLAAGLTAWMGLHALHQLQPGETVLVQGASGSVGAILSRWARRLGATVIGVAGSETKLAKVAAGADQVIQSRFLKSAKQTFRSYFIVSTHSRTRSITALARAACACRIACSESPLASISSMRSICSAASRAWAV